MLKKYKDSIRDILVIFFLSLTPLLWFRPGTLMVGHDNVAPLDPPAFFQNRLSTWSDQFFGQSQVLILGTIPIHALDALPSYLGISLQTGQKIIFVTWFFLIGLSSYILGMVLQPKSSVFKLLASTMYQFNFFILQGWWIAEKSKFSAYVAFPLIIAILISVERGSLTALIGAVLTSMVVFLFNAGGMFGIPLYGGVFVTALCFLLFFYKSKPILHYVFFSLVLTLSINSYYVIPAVFKLASQFQSGIAQIGGASGVVSWASEISANANFLNLVRLQGIPDWYDNPEHPYAKLFLTNPWLIAISFMWPLLVFAALLRSRTHRSRPQVLFLVFAYLVGLFFAAGTHPPLGAVYQWLIEHVPGFAIFRTPYYKFAPAIFLSTSFLIAYFVDCLSPRSRRIIFPVLFGVVLLYHFPYFTGDFFQWRKGFSTRLTVPEYIFDFARWLKEEKEDDRRVLLLPPNSPDLEYSLYRWGYLSFQAIPTLFGNTPVVVNNDKLNSSERTLTTALYRAILNGDENRVRKLSSLLHIGYVVLQRDTYAQVKSSWMISPEPYQKAIFHSSLFTPVKQFDSWELFALKTEVDPLFTMHTQTVAFAGSVTDVDISLDHLDDPLGFITTGTSREESPKTDIFSSEIIVPACINCPKRSKPLIRFPVRNILPGSPLYPFVLMNEERVKPRDSKSTIYHALGISLKRVAEISELVMQQKVLKKEVVDHYQATLMSIRQNFVTLTSQKDKIEVATDVLLYLRAERTYLRPTMSDYLSIGQQTVMVGQMFYTIAQTESYFSPFAAPIEESTRRWYEFAVDTPGAFELFYRSDKTAPHISLPTEVSVDAEVGKRVEGKRFLQSRWVHLGTFELTGGYHTITVTSPQASQVSYSLTPMQTEFSANDNSCFGTTVASVESSKVYKITTHFFNNFSDNLFLYVWEGNQDSRALTSAAKLSSGPTSEKREDFIEPSSGTDTITVALCAPNMTQILADRQFSLEVSETTYPSVLLKPVKNKEVVSVPVQWKKESPTRYSLILPSSDISKILVFSQRYDPWWKLEGYDKSHVEVNGYANGWIIDAPTSSPLLLEYLGQTYFRWGIFVTAATILFNLSLLLLGRKKK